MRKLIRYILPLALVLCLLAGCGGDDTGTADNTPADTGNNAADSAQQPKPEEKSLTDGYWVLEKMTMEGTEFSGPDLESLFGPAESIMALAFGESGDLNGVFFDEPLKGTWSGAESAFEMDIAGEKATGACASGTMEIKLADGSGFTLKNQDEMPEALANNPWVTYAPEFDSAATISMSNFMSFGRYLIEDDVLYGLTHAVSLNGSLGATQFYMNGDFPAFEETVILDDSGLPSYICKDGDYLYYIVDYEMVCRVKTDGTGREVLYEGICDYLQIHDGRLWFTDADYHFVSTDMNGGDLKTIVDKEIYYPYFIGSDWMIFQDDADDESLHLYNVTHGEELNITYVPSYNPILDGHYLYYVDSDYCLCRIDMSDPDTFLFDCSELPLLEAGFMIDDKYFYGTNDNRVDKEDWKELTETADTVDSGEVYVSEDYTVYHELDSDGLITGKYLMSKNQNGATSFA